MFKILVSATNISLKRIQGNLLLHQSFLIFTSFKLIPCDLTICRYFRINKSNTCATINNPPKNIYLYSNSVTLYGLINFCVDRSGYFCSVVISNDTSPTTHSQQLNKNNLLSTTCPTKMALPVHTKYKNSSNTHSLGNTDSCFLDLVC